MTRDLKSLETVCSKNAETYVYNILLHCLIFFSEVPWTKSRRKCVFWFSLFLDPIVLVFYPSFCMAQLVINSYQINKLMVSSVR